jgi:hypothetical protein
VWTWADDQTAGFWLRRITHDTLVHRLDAELAVGREVTLAPDLAADSVSDLLEMFSTLPRIDDFPALAELAAAASCCTSMPPTRAWASPVNGWPTGSSTAGWTPPEQHAVSRGQSWGRRKP